MGLASGEVNANNNGWNILILATLHFQIE